MIKFIEAILMLSGMIIGVGMFGIPFSFAQSGFALGMAELAFLAVIVAFLHLLYADVVLGTSRMHRLPGYVRHYLGEKAGWLAHGSALFGIGGTLLAYAVLGGIFLQAALFPIGTGIAMGWWVLSVAGVVAVVNVFSLRRAVFLNGLLTGVLVIFIIAVASLLLPGVNPENLKGVNPAHIFTPYGVLVFALSGGVVIPDVMSVLSDRKRARKAIWIGTLLPAVMYAIFALAVVGVAGDAVTPDAISGLQPFAGSSVVRLGSIVGFFAVITSYIVLHGSYRQLLSLDVGIPRFPAHIIASALPLALYASGIHNFIAVIGAVGAIALGLDSGLILMVYRRMRIRGGTPLPAVQKAKLYVIAFVLAAGFIYEIGKLIFF